MRFIVCAIYLSVIMPMTSGWAEGSNILLDPKQACRKTNKIPNKILDICKQDSRNKTSLLKKIEKGISLGFHECENQFRHRKWNCTSQRRSMKKILLRDTRETAFVNAITSAGIAYTIAKACSMGELVECSCDKNLVRHNVLLNNNQMTTFDNNDNNNSNNNNNNKNRTKKPKRNGNNKKPRNHKVQRKSPAQLPTDGSGLPVVGENWEWSGCDDNVNFGHRKSKDFLDARFRRRSDIKTLVKIHNNDAGRVAVRKSMRLDCKCHGLSGSCTMKTCWMKLPSFSEVAHRLRDRFDGSSKVIAKNDGTSFMTEDIKHPTKQDLVYTDESPDFCMPNLKTGSLGVKDRECNITSNGEDGCEILCCNSGFQRSVTFVKSNCKCRFIWCCEVVCSTCTEKKEIYTCRILPAARQELRRKIKVLSVSEVRRHRLPLHEALLLDLDKGGFKSAQNFFQKLIDYDLSRSKVLVSDNELLEVIFEELKRAEYSQKEDEADILVKLGTKVEDKKIENLFWLSVNIYERALSLIRIYKLDHYRIDAVAQFFYGKLLSTQNEKLEEATSFLDKAFEISYGVDEWLIDYDQQTQQSLNSLVTTHLCTSLLRLSRKKRDEKPDEALFLAKKSKKFIRKTRDENNLRLEIESEIEIADCFKVKSQLDQALLHYELAVVLSTSGEFFELAFAVLVKISECIEGDDKQYEESLNRSIEFSKKYKLSASKASVLVAMGRFDIQRGNFAEAKIHLEEASKVYKRVGDLKKFQYLHFLMGPLKAQENFNDLVETILKSDKTVPGKNFYLSRLLLWYDRKNAVKNLHHEFYFDPEDVTNVEDFVAKYFDPDEITRIA